MARFAAKLLFQFSVSASRQSRRLCEERIISFDSSCAKAALKYAKLYGREHRNQYKNAEGGTVKFEFVGVMDILELDYEYHPEEVWYDMRRRLVPVERKDRLIPRDRVLLNRLTPSKRRTTPRKKRTRKRENRRDRKENLRGQEPKART